MHNSLAIVVYMSLVGHFYYKMPSEWHRMREKEETTKKSEKNVSD